MATITLRSVKGSPLTNAEVDANFSNLNTDKIEASALTPYLTSASAASTYAPISHTHAAADITSGTLDNARVNWAAPGTIGSTTPNTGAFTTLSSTGNATLASSSGSVGVGVSPTSKFHVYDAASSTVAVQGDATTTTNLLRASTDALSPIHLVRKSRGSIASPSAVSTGDNAGIIRFQAYSGSGYRNVADIIANVSTYTSDTALSGALLFRTNNSSTDVTERARITHDGRFFLGSTNTALNAGIVNAVAPAAADIAGIYSNPTISSSTTGSYNGYVTTVSTAAASFTLPSLVHFSANQATFGAGSTVTNQYGFVAASNLTGAGTNIGFLSEIPSGGGRFNFYASGTADNYFAGNVGIGTSSPNAGNGRVLHLYNNANTGDVASNTTFILESVNRNANIVCPVPNVGGSTAWACRSADLATLYGQIQIVPNNSVPYIGFFTSTTSRMRITSTAVEFNHGITEKVFTITDGAGFEIDPANGTVQLITLGASRTPAATNFAAGQSVLLMVNDGTAYTITWTTIGVVWVGGAAPTLATTGYTVIELWKVGSTVYGAHVGNVA